MPTSPRLAAYLVLSILFWLAVALAIFAHLGGGMDVSAATVEPLATPTPETCTHVANADSMKIYYCEDIYLFVNDRGFMAFEP